MMNKTVVILCAICQQWHPCTALSYNIVKQSYVGLYLIVCEISQYLCMCISQHLSFGVLRLTDNS